MRLEINLLPSHTVIKIWHLKSRSHVCDNLAGKNKSNSKATIERITCAMIQNRDVEFYECTIPNVYHAEMCIAAVIRSVFCVRCYKTLLFFSSSDSVLQYSVCLFVTVLR